MPIVHMLLSVRTLRINFESFSPIYFLNDTNKLHNFERRLFAHPNKSLGLPGRCQAVEKLLESNAASL